jgi:hypothetical protein
VCNRTLPAWVKFQNNINAVEMYSDTDGIVDKLLEDLKKQPISKLKAMGRGSGTQLHFMYKLDDDGRALFKPQRLALFSSSSSIPAPMII